MRPRPFDASFARAIKRSCSTISSLVFAAGLLLLSSPAAAQTFTPPNTPYQLYPGPDTAAIVGGMVLWVAPTLTIHNQIHGPGCDPCDPNDVNGFDRLFIPGRGTIPNNEDTIDRVRFTGNALFALEPPLWLGLELADIGFHNPKAFFTDFAILPETLAWSGATDEIFRRSVHRPRPYVYANNDAGAPLFAARRVEGEAAFSYYSGHTAQMFAFSVVLAYTWSTRHPHSAWRYPVWIGLLTMSTLEGVLRVWSGDHYPSDVLVGAMMGSAFGVLVPMIHRKWTKDPVLSSLSLVPSQRDGMTTFWLGGRF